MKKLIKILGILVGAIIVIVAIAALYINFSSTPKYAYNPPQDYPIDMSPEQIAEGTRIAQTMCVQCHKSPDGKLGGAKLDDAPEFGDIHRPISLRIRNTELQSTLPLSSHTYSAPE